MLDAVYVGTLRSLLQDAFPGAPEMIFASVDEEKVVIKRSMKDEAPSALVGFEPSTLRVVKSKERDKVSAWHDTYGPLLNMTIQPSRYLETDLKGASLFFHESFFAPRECPILGSESAMEYRPAGRTDWR